MSQPDFYAILDECVSRVRQGESPQACLADYPSYAGELTPDLTLTAELIHISPLEPSPDAVAAGYQEMMAALDNQARMSPLASLSTFVGGLFSTLGRRPRGFAATALRLTAVTVVILVIAGGFVVTAAANTLPGDVLYPVKRSWEDARLTLTTNETSRSALRSEFEKRRREEVQAVLELRRPVVVDFTGVVESLAADMWRVDGLDLTITNDTQVIGAVAVGQSITARAQVKDDGSLIALRIVADEAQPGPRPTPTFTARPAQTSRPVQRDEATPTASAAPGLVATRDEMATRGEVVPTPTPSPGVTRPQATASGNLTDRPTLEPTSTPVPSVDSAPTTAAAPTADSTPTREPTKTPSTDSLATAAPRPTKTPTNSEPTPTSRPVDVAPKPTATSTPYRDKVPNPTPTATRGRDADGLYDRPP